MATRNFQRPARIQQRGERGEERRDKSDAGASKKGNVMQMKCWNVSY